MNDENKALYLLSRNNNTVRYTPEIIAGIIGAGIGYILTKKAVWSAIGAIGGVVMVNIATCIIERVITKTSDYTAENNDCVLVNAAGGGVTITLPSAKRDLHVNVKKIDSSANAVTVVGVSGATIDGAVSLSVTTQWFSYTLVSDGSNWYIK